MRNRLRMRNESWHADHVKPTAIQRWARLERPKRVLLLEAVGAVCAASLAVKMLPFRWAIRLSSKPSPPPCRESRAAALSDVRWAIDAATRHLPWNPVCIQRGLAAQWMLRRRGIDARLHYGLTNDDRSELRAHVWVEVLGKTFVGEEDANEYVRVATFP
jgi:hypothetical protein